MKEITRQMNISWHDEFEDCSMDMTLPENKQIFVDWLGCKEHIVFNIYYYKIKKFRNRKKIIEKLCKI